MKFSLAGDTHVSQECHREITQPVVEVMYRQKYPLQEWQILFVDQTYQKETDKSYAYTKVIVVAMNSNGLVRTERIFSQDGKLHLTTERSTQLYAETESDQ